MKATPRGGGRLSSGEEGFLPPSAPAAAPAQARNDDRVNILLVDDRPDKLLALESILGSLGQNLVRANSGREALRALLHDDYAVILLDVNMPGMDGFETAEMIRSRDRSQRTPIIFFTAMSEAESHVFRSYSLGAVDFIRTPVVPEILKAKVNVFVDLYKKTEQVKRQAEEMRRLQEREHQTRMAEAKDRLEVETRRNRFFTLALDMLAIADFGGTFMQLNPSWEKTLGFSDEELKSRPLLDFVHPDDREATAQRLEELRGGAQVAYFENRFAARGGGWRWLGWTAAPFAEEGLLYIFARDLTERRVAEEERVKLIREQTARAAAEASERRAAFLAEATAAITESLDFDETLRRLADVAVPTLGDSCIIDVVEEGGLRRVAVAHANPAQGELADALVACASGSGADGPQGEALQAGRTLLFPEIGPAELDRLARSPEHRQILARMALRAVLVVPLMARDRCFATLTLAAAGSGRRYTREDQELAQELARRAALAVDNARLYRTSQEARRAAEKANRAKDEFLATLSHELRTPLTPILGWTVMLRSGNLDAPSVVRGLEVIERNVRAQTQLIGDLLDVSRIITGKLRLEVRHIELPPVVEAGIEAVRTSAEAKDIALQVDLQPDLPPVSGDPDRLQQVVWNLVSNAVKFTPNGGRIGVSLRRANSHVELRVTDTGKGISRDFLPFVFDRFRQADSTSTRAHGGLGLGLAIVRHLVELHGGTVVAESEGEGRGSTFVAHLPLAVPPSRTDQPGDGTGPRLDGVRVFVVEGEAALRTFLAGSLKHHGADVTVFATTAEALAAVEDRPPHVLVSGLALPGEDGFQLIRRVRALAPERGGQTPAAALTVSGGDDSTRVLSAGFQLHLPKPVDPGHLAHAVATLAGRA